MRGGVVKPNDIIWFFIFCILLHETCKRGALMYYQNLARQYLKDAEILKKHIKKLRTQYVKIDDDADEEFKYRISLLYGMYLDLMHIGKYLIRKCEVMKKDES